MTTTTITISNIAGGSAKQFRWNGRLSDAAIRYARRLEGVCGGPQFSSPEAAADYDALRGDAE